MAAVMPIYTVGLTNNREGVLERTQFLEVSADSPSAAMQLAWETPAGLAFMLVHCKLYPRKSAWIQSVRPALMPASRAKKPARHYKNHSNAAR
jgi:hypothetical protein